MRQPKPQPSNGNVALVGACILLSTLIVGGIGGHALDRITARDPLTALCSTVHNQVNYPSGVLHDISDLTWDISHNKPHAWAQWESKVIACSLEK